MNWTGRRQVMALVLSLALSACDEPSSPTRETVTDVAGVWQGTDASLGGFSQAVIWTITQNGDTFTGTWNNGAVPAGTAISGQVTGVFDQAAQRVTYSMTWMPSSPNPYWVCAGFYQDPLVTSGSGSVSRNGVIAAMSVSYGNWTGCRGNVESRPTGQLGLVRQ
jgi:hypothetical protein